MRLYLDSAPIIYTVEQTPGFYGAVDRLLSRASLVLVASDLTRMECRVKPMREGNLGLLEDFEEFFDEVVEELLPLSREGVNLATEIRARYGFYGFKVPDSLHLATALEAGCDAFLTNDHRLDRFSGLAVEIVEP